MRLIIQRSGDTIWIQGDVLDKQRHSHPAMQLVWSNPERPAIHEYGRGQRLEAAVTLVMASAPHALLLEDGLICLMEQESKLARQLRARWLQRAPVVALPQTSTPPSLAHAQTLLDELRSADEPVMTLDERVVEVLRWLDELEAAARFVDVSLEGALKRVHLSSSRFLHVFSAQVGTPWRSYLVWRRALCAMTLASQGCSLTEAAHAVGYADAAHLSRQFSALFGVSPSMVSKNSQFVQA